MFSCECFSNILAITDSPVSPFPVLESQQIDGSLVHASGKIPCCIFRRISYNWSISKTPMVRSGNGVFRKVDKNIQC